MDNYHIKKAEKSWVLVKEGGQDVSKSASTKAEIIAMDSQFLQGKTASLKIHSKRPAKSSTQSRKAKTWCPLKFKWTPCLAF